VNLCTFSAMTDDDARAALLRCCGSRRWADEMLARRPFASAAQFLEAADEVWQGLERAAWLEAFAAHPRIGERMTGGSEWSRAEQAGVAGAADTVLAELDDANRSYEKRFGFIFIVCASGKSAAEMLAILRSRLFNDPESELKIAVREQAKITRLRLEKL
jgi:2-oxo-4-hydroxy-4-carboxy-5-ureidoimidazoline decarboxylase